MSDKRALGIAQRKERIFAAARSIIARDGFEALTTRALAKAAGLTVPTLYNLIGDKTEIIAQTLEGSVEKVWQRLEFDRRATPLEMADAIIDEAYAVIREDRNYHRSILTLLDRAGISFAANAERTDAGARAAQRCVDMAEFACEAAIREGLLRGNIPASELGQLMFMAYRGPMRDWIEHVVEDDEMLRRQRRGFYLVMASDASDAFRAHPIERTSALSPAQPIKEVA